MNYPANRKRTNRLNDAEYIGKTFGVLTIIAAEGTERTHRDRGGICKCVCGNQVRVPFYKLKNGHTSSCGCQKIKILVERSTTHGMHHHPLSHVYEGMIQRCYNPKEMSYRNYGGRGVRVCEMWLNDKQSYFKWALENGWKQGMEIDKDIKGDGLLYSPETCSIVTTSVNMRHTRQNRMITYKGETRCLTEWCEILGLKYTNIKSRLHNNPHVRADLLFETPFGKWMVKNSC